MKKLQLLLLFLVLGFSFSYSQTQSKPITEISEKLLKNAVLIDVRTPEEYNAGHLPSAINVNWYDTDFTEQLSHIDKNTTIYFYCKVGGRSAQATERLKTLGYVNVVNLEGGYDTWAKNQ